MSAIFETCSRDHNILELFYILKNFPSPQLKRKTLATIVYYPDLFLKRKY